MGMAASQARYLSLVAQQSNLEYQGQQINQERSILSQQVSDLYNNLLSLQVPTPPSTQDFTQITYQGSLNATVYQFDATSVKPGSNNTYIVTFESNDYGHAMQKTMGTSTASKQTQVNVTPITIGTTQIRKGDSPINTPGSPITPTVDYMEEFTGDPSSYPGPGPCYIEENGELVEYDPSEHTGSYSEYFVKHSANTQYTGTNYIYEIVQIITDADLVNLYILDNSSNNPQQIRKATKDDVTVLSDGSYILDNSKTYYLKDNSSQLTMDLSSTEYTVAGHSVMTLAEANNSGYITGEQLDAYRKAIEHANLYDAAGQKYTEDDFYIYFNDDGKACFVLKNEVHTQADKTGGQGQVSVYNYISNGQFVNSRQETDCKLTFDPSSGRIISIDVPNRDNDNNILGYTRVNLSAKTVTDTLAYDQAMAEYEYAQYEYDVEQQKINAKTELIQRQDRELELKLTRLDTQRKQITTELEAIKEVIKKNIDNSYKTFHG